MSKLSDSAGSAHPWRSAAALVAAGLVVLGLLGGPDLAVNTPRDAWVALYYWSLMVVLALACAIPHRAVEHTERTS